MVAVAPRGGYGSSRIGATGRLGEELNPDLFPAQDGGNMTQLLILGPKLEQQGHRRDERRRLDVRWIVVSVELAVEGRLMCGGEALSAVFDRNTDAGEAAVVELALKMAAGRDARKHVLIGVARRREKGVSVGLRCGRHVVSQPGTRANGEVVGAYLGAHLRRSPGSAASTNPTSRWVKSAGVANAFAATTARRNRTCRSWSAVTPMPPWSWTQS